MLYACVRKGKGKGHPRAHANAHVLDVSENPEGRVRQCRTHLNTHRTAPSTRPHSSTSPTPPHFPCAPALLVPQTCVADGLDRRSSLLRLAQQVEGVYVPQFYEAPPVRGAQGARGGRGPEGRGNQDAAAGVGTGGVRRRQTAKDA